MSLIGGFGFQIIAVILVFYNWILILILIHEIHAFHHIYTLNSILMKTLSLVLVKKKQNMAPITGVKQECEKERKFLMSSPFVKMKITGHFVHFLQA